MNIVLQKIIITLLVCVVWRIGCAEPMLLPNAKAAISQTGVLGLSEDNKVTVTGAPITLQTSVPLYMDAENGTYLFTSGVIQYNDGGCKITGNIIKAVLGRYIENGKVIYMLKGQLHGKMQLDDNRDVTGHFSVRSVPMTKDLKLNTASLEMNHIILSDKIVLPDSK